MRRYDHCIHNIYVQNTSNIYTSQYITRYNSLSLYITIHHNISQYITRYHSISLYITLYHSISLYITIYHYIYIYHYRSLHITIYLSISLRIYHCIHYNILQPHHPPHFSLQLTPPESFIGPCLAPEADVIEIVAQLLEELLGMGRNL